MDGESGKLREYTVNPKGVGAHPQGWIAHPRV